MPIDPLIDHPPRHDPPVDLAARLRQLPPRRPRPPRVDGPALLIIIASLLVAAMTGERAFAAIASAGTAWCLGPGADLLGMAALLAGSCCLLSPWRRKRDEP